MMMEVPCVMKVVEEMHMMPAMTMAVRRCRDGNQG
jgi:hypothetical protein